MMSAEAGRSRVLSENSPVAIVTGGSGGIGRATCQQLAEAGYRVAAVSRGGDALAKTVAALPGGSECHIGVAVDVGNARSVERMVQAVMQRWGRIDALVVGAGIGSVDPNRRVPVPFQQLSLQEWEQVMATNLDGAFNCCRSVLPGFLGVDAGCIVLVGSALTPDGQRGRPFAPAYSASKFALTGLAQALAVELAATGVRIHLVQPGTVETPLLANTALARDFGGMMSARHVGQFIRDLLDAESNPDWDSAHLMPFFPRPGVPGAPGRR